MNVGRTRNAFVATGLLLASLLACSSGQHADDLGRPADTVDALADAGGDLVTLPDGACTQAWCEATLALTSPCQQVRCDEASGRCVVDYRPEGEPCDDGDPCTRDDACRDGGCEGAPLVCESEAPCVLATCDPLTGGCREDAAPDGLVCGSPPAPCRVMLCQAGRCAEQAAPEDEPCEAVFPCTLGDRCVAGQCVAGTQPACDDGQDCTEDLCAPETGLCSHTPREEGAECDDGDPCTVDDRCVAAVCEGAPRTCDDGNPCTSDTCDAATGECRAAPVANESPCASGDPCGVEGRCRGGLCEEEARSCDDGDACTADGCGPAGCLFLPLVDGEPCEDGDPCTIEDGCQPGGCVGRPVEDCCQADADCEDGDPCTTARCEAGSCLREPLTCPAPEGGCGFAWCAGACQADVFARPTALFDFPARAGDAPRAWPPGAWRALAGGGRLGLGALTLAPGQAGWLRVPERDWPAGTLSLELSARPGEGGCAEGEALLRVEAEGAPIGALACPSDGGWARLVLPFGAAEATQRRLSVVAASAGGLEIDSLRVVFRGRAGCPLGAPVHVPGSEGATHLALSAGTFEQGLVAWSAQADVAREVAWLAEPSEAGEPAVLDQFGEISVGFGLTVASGALGDAVAWGGAGGEAHLGYLVAPRAGAPTGGYLELPAGSADHSPRLLALPGGDWRLFWARSGEDEGLHTARLGPQGLVADSQRRLSPALRDAVDVARLAAGGFVAVFPVTAGVAETVALLRLDADLNTLTPDAELLEDPATLPAGARREQPRVAALADGGFVVVWEARDANTTGWDVFHQLFEADGSPRVPISPLATVTTNDQRRPAVAADPEGGWLAVWESDEEVVLQTRIRYAISGNAPEWLAPPDVIGSKSPDIAPGQASGLWVAWIDQIAGDLAMTELPGRCAEGWWRCGDGGAEVCAPGGYLPLLGACEGEGCLPPPACP